jgi:thiamine-phosphate pyrophosphorylase
MTPLPMSPLYPIFDRQFFPEDSMARSAFMERTVEEFGALGLTLMQLRWKDAEKSELRDCAAAFRKARRSSLHCILNDHALLARELGFDGVHLGRLDMPIVEARTLLKAEAIIGLSTHNASEVVAAHQAGADYIAIGPVFATSTKADAEPVVGLEGVRAARALTNKPLVAIGGITLENAARVREAGADSVAAISALFGDSGRSPAKIAEDFLRRMR